MRIFAQILKMKKLFFAAICLVALSFSACNKKNQDVVKDLEGDWTLSAKTENGVAVPASEIAGTTYSFQLCKVRKDDCDGSISVADSTKGTITNTFTYSITDDASKFNMTVSLLGLSETVTADIIEHSASKFVFEYNDAQTDSSSANVTVKVRETLSKK